MAEGTTITVGQLSDSMQAAMTKALAQWSQNQKPATPAATADLKQDGSKPETSAKFAQSLDVLVNGEPRKAELLDKDKGTYGLTKMHAGIAEGLDNFKVPLLNVALPIGSAIVGGALGTIEFAVVDAVVAPTKTNADGTTSVNFVNPLLQIAVAAMTVKMGSKYIGRDAALISAGVTVLGLALRYTPLNSWITSLETSISGALPKLGQGMSNAAPAFQQGAMSAPMMPRHAMSGAYA